MIYLITYMYEPFDLHLKKFYVQKHVEKAYIYNFFVEEKNIWHKTESKSNS
jgi:hypothetical protein